MHRYDPSRTRNLLLTFLAIAIMVFTSQVLPTGQQTVAQAAANRALSNPIQRENQLPGTPDWQISHIGTPDSTNYTNDLSIEGYASATSVLPGQTISFAVNTTTSSFNADIYRLGWYHGNGGRLIQTIPNIAGHSYKVPSPNLKTGLVEARWPAAFAVIIPTNWVSGMYLVKLTNLKGEQSYIPFTVKSTRKSDLIFVHTANTDEAYNSWGGTSLYQDLTVPLAAGRAFQVSFDRPLNGNYGAGFLLSWEYPMIRWLEKDGYDVSYISDVDVNMGSQVLLGHHGILLAGHSEYWSTAMRNHLETAVSSGVNLGAFGANDLYWQIRYGSSSSGTPNRVITCYKDASLDPLATRNPSKATVQFRQSPVNRPEQTVLGSMFNSFFAESEENLGFPWIVNDASSWVFAGTGLQNGASLPGLVGYEFDSVSPDYAGPSTIFGADGVNGVEVLSTSPVTDIYNNQSNANTTLYTATSGARVFNAGTIQWSWGLDGYSLLANPPNVVNQSTQQITANILHNFITGAITPGNVI